MHSFTGIISYPAQTLNWSSTAIASKSFRLGGCRMELHQTGCVPAAGQPGTRCSKMSCATIAIWSTWAWASLSRLFKECRHTTGRSRALSLKTSVLLFGCWPSCALRRVDSCSLERVFGTKRESDHISNSAVAAISVAVLVFIELGVVLRARETFVAVWTLHGVRHS